jgi:hypothetical protein
VVLTFSISSSRGSLHTFKPEGSQTDYFGPANLPSAMLTKGDTLVRVFGVKYSSNKFKIAL